MQPKVAEEAGLPGGLRGAGGRHHPDVTGWHARPRRPSSMLTLFSFLKIRLSQGSSGDGVPRKYFSMSADQSQSLKSNPHTTENRLLHLSPLSLEKRKRSVHSNPSERAAARGARPRPNPPELRPSLCLGGSVCWALSGAGCKALPDALAGPAA